MTTIWLQGSMGGNATTHEWGTRSHSTTIISVGTSKTCNLDYIWSGIITNFNQLHVPFVDTSKKDTSSCMYDDVIMAKQYKKGTPTSNAQVNNSYHEMNELILMLCEDGSFANHASGQPRMACWVTSIGRSSGRHNDFCDTKSTQNRTGHIC